MKPEQKILTTALWILAVMGMVCVVGAKLWNRHGESAGSDVYVVEDPEKNNDGPIGTAPDFSLLDQNAQPFTKRSLAGHPFIADFIYTHCAGPCPLMTEKMAALQKQLPQMQFVSVSVDPTNDTPDVLKNYAKQHHADESSWHFLTGKEDAVVALARGMLSSAAPATKDSQ